MSYPFGKDAIEIADGEYVGTTPEGLQRVIGSLFASEGIVPGGDIPTVTGTTGWAYRVSPGAVYARTSDTENMGYLIPIEDVTVTVAAAPASGGREDTIYVDYDGVVRTSSSRTPNGFVLDTRYIEAGATNTNSSVSMVDRDFAILAGASVGKLHSYYDPTNGPGPTSKRTLGSGKFVLPTDRHVRFDLTHCIGAIWDDATPGQQGDTSVIRWKIYIDNSPEFTFTTRAEWDQAQTNFLSFTKTLEAGSHTVKYVQDLQAGDPFRIFKGGSDGFVGNCFEVWDAGAAQ